MAKTLRRQLEDLDTAMATGVLTVEGEDGMGRVTYRSYPEMRAARADLVKRIAAEDALNGKLPPQRVRQVVMTGRSGF